MASQIVHIFPELLSFGVTGTLFGSGGHVSPELAGRGTDEFEEQRWIVSVIMRGMAFFSRLLEG